jgi:hypothetical protein
MGTERGRSACRNEVDNRAGAFDRSKRSCNRHIRIDRAGRFQLPARIPISASIESPASSKR